MDASQFGVVAQIKVFQSLAYFVECEICIDRRTVPQTVVVKFEHSHRSAVNKLEIFYQVV